MQSFSIERKKLRQDLVEIHKALGKLNMEPFFTNDVSKKTSSTGHLVKPTDRARIEGSTSHSMSATLCAKGVETSRGRKDPWSGYNLHAGTEEVWLAWEAESMVLGRQKTKFLGLSGDLQAVVGQ